MDNLEVNGEPPQIAWTTRTMIQSFGANATGTRWNYTLNNNNICIVPKFQFPFSLSLTRWQRRRRRGWREKKKHNNDSNALDSHRMCVCVWVFVWLSFNICQVFVLIAALCVMTLCISRVTKNDNHFSNQSFWILIERMHIELEFCYSSINW